jgi:hypothetical protein
MHRTLQCATMYRSVRYGQRIPWQTTISEAEDLQNALNRTNSSGERMQCSDAIRETRVEK